MRIICTCRHARCGLIALMSFFVMGFQFMPSGGGLNAIDKQNLKQYAHSLRDTGDHTAIKAEKKNDTSWFGIKFTLPHADFGLDSLYGLDEQDTDQSSEDIKF